MEEQNQGPQVSDYFTEEVEERIREMTDQEMMNEMVGFEGTRAWFAILRYIRLRTSVIQNVLFMKDPVTEPTDMARAQGIMIGLSDLQDGIIVEKFNREASEEGKTKKSK